MTNEAPGKPVGMHPAPDDAWLESLLRHDAATTPYIDDAGFSAAMLAQLPARARPSRSRWIVPGMGLLGFLIGLVWMSGGTSLSSHIASLAQMRSLSIGDFFVAALPLGLLYWLAVGAAWQER